MLNSYLNSTILTFLFQIPAYFQSNNPSLTVQTKYGQLEGIQSTSRNGQTYYEFLGIPFAKPPIDELRFESPVEVQNWEGIKRVDKIPFQCLQIHIAFQKPIGSEDCLYLNVFTKVIESVDNTTTKPTKLNPVLIYLHGGIFMAGGSQIYGGRYLLDKDLVVVVPQYRLGVFGFLNTGDNGLVRGNMALKDQLLALKWVQDNIHVFGGDKNRVTLAGQSAGAVCVHLHAIMAGIKPELYKGLFHQVITQSGNVLNPWGFKWKPKEQAMDFARKVNCPTNSTMNETVNCLKSMDSIQLVQGHVDYTHKLYDELAVFGPTIESGNDNDTFLNENPIYLMDKSVDLPWLNGVNSHEGLLFAAKMTINETIAAEVSTNWSGSTSKFLPVNKTEESIELYKYYINQTIDKNNTEPISIENIENISNLLSDFHFNIPIHKLIEWKLNRINSIQEEEEEAALLKSSAPMYLYYYSYKGEFSGGNIILNLSHKLPLALDYLVSTGWSWIKEKFGSAGQHYGAGHADEVFLLFKLPYLTQHEAGTKDYEMSLKMVDIWYEFINTGTPLSAELMETDKVNCWKPVGEFCPLQQQDKNINSRNELDKSISIQYMKLDKQCEIILEPFHERLKYLKEQGIRI